MKPKPFPETPQTLEEHLKRCRLIRGLTLTETAGLLGVDFTTVHNWEKGKTKPYSKHVQAIVRFLGYDPFPAASNEASRWNVTRFVRNEAG